MIKTVFFDLGGVIVDLHPQEAYRRWDSLGIDSAKWLDPYGQKGVFKQVETGEISEEEFLQAVSQLAGREISYDEAMHVWLGFIGSVQPEMLSLVQKLRRHYRVCLASNTNPFIMNYMRSPAFHNGMPIDYYFDALYCSCDMKQYKPDAAFFEQLLTLEGISANEAIFIDDSEKNTLSASAVGLTALQL